jgi:two-component system response regulator RegX3
MTETHQANRKCIFFIEDEAELGELLASRLERSGYEVQTACNGQDALARIESVNPDLVLLDLTLPDISGSELCEIIRKNKIPKISKLPILILSGKAPEILEQVCQSSGANAYVVKPYKPIELLKEIERCLSGKAEK